MARGFIQVIEQYPQKSVKSSKIDFGLDAYDKPDSPIVTSPSIKRAEAVQMAKAFLIESESGNIDMQLARKNKIEIERARAMLGDVSPPR